MPFVDLVWIGAALSTALMAVGMCLLYKLTNERFGRAIARRTVLFMSISPLAFVFSAVYAESLFLVLVAGTFLLAERGRFLGASLLAALGVLTRPVGLALVPALAVDGLGRARGPLEAHRADRAAARWPRPLFALYLWWETGDLLAQTHAQARGWGRSLGPAAGRDLARLHRARCSTATSCASSCTSPSRCVWTVMLVELWKRRDEVPIPYLLFAAGCVLLPFAAGSLVSAGRIGMLGFPLFWALAILARREGIDTTVKVVSPALMAGLIFVTYGIRHLHAVNRLAARLRERIAASGPISFSAFMESALYDERGRLLRPRRARSARAAPSRRRPSPRRSWPARWLPTCARCGSAWGGPRRSRSSRSARATARWPPASRPSWPTCRSISCCASARPACSRRRGHAFPRHARVAARRAVRRQRRDRRQRGARRLPGASPALAATSCSSGVGGDGRFRWVPGPPAGGLGDPLRAAGVATASPAASTTSRRSRPSCSARSPARSRAGR